MSILAIVSRSQFEKAVASPAVGGLWPVTTYVSSNPGLEPLGQGGDLYLVTVRPNDTLWLAAVLRSPKKGAKGWTARANTAPIHDATSIIKELRFANGKGLTFGAGTLGMSLQTPRQLTDDDVARFEALLGKGGSKKTPPPREATERAKTKTPARKTATHPTTPSASTSAEPLAAAPFWALCGLPTVESLTPKTFAALPKTKVSALLAKAERGLGQDVTRLLRLTHCANYLVCIGSLGVALRRSHVVIDPKLKLLLAEVLFAYQVDWRYPKPFGITITDMDAARREMGLRRAFAFEFFELIEQTPSYFSCVNPFSTTSSIVTLTRHLLGKQAAAYNAWLAGVIDRLARVAKNPTPKASIYLRHYPSEKAWKAAIDVRHGRPLPLELLDLSREMPPETKWPALVAATFAHLSPENNKLLQPRATLIKRGLARPYAR
jgi:hypothetical protein